MLSRIALSPLLALLALTAAHAQDEVQTPAQEAVEIIQRQYLVLGEATGHDLSGNNLKTAAEQIAEGIKAEPKKENAAVASFCGEIIKPEVVAKTKRLKELSASLPSLQALLNDEDFKAIVAYPSSLCGQEFNQQGLSKELEESIASVKGKFKVYFTIVRNKAFEERLGRYYDKAMEIMSNLIDDEPAEAPGNDGAEK